MTRISRIAAKNFRSFRDIEVDLGPLEVIIGPNAAGKSNLVEVVRFLSDITRTGFENAVSLHGGPEFIPNASSPDEETVLSITVEHDPPSAAWPFMGFDSRLQHVCVPLVRREKVRVALVCDRGVDCGMAVSSCLQIDAVIGTAVDKDGS